MTDKEKISLLRRMLKRQKAEIKMLEKCCDDLESEIERMDYDMDLLKHEIRVIKSEARREFAERLKGKSYIVSDESRMGIMSWHSCVTANQIDNLLKEMESDSNA